MSLKGCTLTYFKIAGRAEPIRLALTIGGIEFTDDRIAGDKWGELKPTTPWGQVPVLTLADGTKLAQGATLLRFVGKQTSLYPDDPLAAARVDEIMDVMNDMSEALRTTGQGMEPPARDAARKEACSPGGRIYEWLKKVEAFISANGSDGHAVGNAMTIADIKVFASMSSLVSGVFDGVPLDTLNAFPKIQALRKMVASHPAVVAYYDARGDAVADAEKAYRDARNL